MTSLPEGLTAGTWNLDPTHANLAFSIRHAGLSRVRGNFPDVSGSLEVGQELEDLRFTVVAQVASVDTGNEDRDNHLRSADFFDAATYPEMTFRSTEVGKKTITGELALHGVTKTVELDYEFEGTATDPFGAYRAGFSGTAKFSRKDFGLTWNAALEAGGVLVSDEVRVAVEAEFVAPTAA
ncbi:YceI family protein [Brachybacterium huguangmaarense]